MAKSKRGKSKAKIEAEYRKKIGTARNIIISVVAMSLAVFIIMIIAALLNEGVSTFISNLLSMNLFYFSIALLIVFISNIMRYPKWELYMKKLGVKLSRAKNIALYLSMYSMEITPGRWGRAVVSYTINRLTGKKFAVTFPAVVADIFTDFLGFIVVTLAAAFLIGEYFWLSVGIAVLLMLPFIFFYFEVPFAFIKKRFGRMKRMREFFENATLYFKSNRKISYSDYIYSMALTIPSMAVNGVALYFVILAFGVNISPSLMPEVIFIFSSSLLLGMITGIPAALGVTDAALLGYLILFFGGSGLTFGVATLITIFFRIANWWFVEGFGFAALAYTSKYWKFGAVMPKKA